MNGEQPEAATGEGHPDDEFHRPADPADPDWSETCWFTFTVPERRLSGQLYPFFKPTLGVVAGGAYFWDDTGDQIWNCLYAKNFWHLPLPDEPLSALRLANGARYRVLEPQRVYEIGYDDPDGDEVELTLVFTAAAAPHYLGGGHLDQPGRFVGRLVLHGETVAVDSYGFRDRSWGVRSQHGPGIHATAAVHGGYSYATASESDAFHAITMDFGSGGTVIHGYLLRDGVWGALESGTREVTARHAESGAPTRVALTARDARGRPLAAEGEALNRLGFAINPNLWTWNCLTRWEFDGVTAYGEDHDNWSMAGQRRFARRHRGARGWPGP
ncbi:MAG: DUF7064 domain-containing protein [Acidimicrobiales bacterium]